MWWLVSLRVQLGLCGESFDTAKLLFDIDTLSVHTDLRIRNCLLFVLEVRLLSYVPRPYFPRC